MPGTNKPRLRPRKPTGIDMIDHMRACSSYPESGCWILAGSSDRDGYVRVNDRVDGKQKTYNAHRYAYLRLVDPDIQPSVILRHTCDTPACWNPDHLIPGTHAENARDKMERGRLRRGEDVGTAILTEDLVREIRSLREAGLSFVKLAEKYGVDNKTIRDVVYRVSWKHVN